MAQHAHKICLNMIVKQEAKTIHQCLDSVVPYISSWCIVDTGSTDGTQDLIRDYFAAKGIPGQLHERPWRDFGANRTEAIELALAGPEEKDYLFVMDADDTLQVSKKNPFSNLDRDAYLFKMTMGGATWWRIQLFRATSEWRYKGVLHESVQGPEGHTTAHLEGVLIAARSSSVTRGNYLIPEDKYLHDAQVFEKAIKDMTPEEDPNLYSRYHFYCAQSYRDAQKYEEAIEWYSRRALLGGWHEEVFYSQYMVAKLKEVLGRPEDEVIGAFMLAWQSRPTRLEAPYNLVRYLNSRRRNFLAWNIARAAIEAPATRDILFIEQDVWGWRLANEWNIACYNVGKVKDAMRAAEALVKSQVFPTIPVEAQEAIKKNLVLFTERYKKQGESSRATQPAKHNIKKRNK
jgi:glycosyltransferase involved in cell wall biosynthesis